MKKKRMDQRKVFIVILLILSITLTGCDKKQPAEKDPLKDGVLKIGTNATYVPMEYRSEDNDLVGFDIDLGNALAEELGVKAEWVDTSWDGIFNGLDNGSYEIVMAGLSITEQRKESFIMSEPYYIDGTVIFGRKGDTEAKNARELENKKVGVQRDTNAASQAESIKVTSGTSYDIIPFDSTLEQFDALEKKTVDYLITDLSVAKFYMKIKPDTYSITSNNLAERPVGIAIPKDEQAFADKVNEAIKKLKSNGKMDELNKKWFGDTGSAASSTQKETEPSPTTEGRSTDQRENASVGKNYSNLVESGPGDNGAHFTFSLLDFTNRFNAIENNNSITYSQWEDGLSSKQARSGTPLKQKLYILGGSMLGVNLELGRPDINSILITTPNENFQKYNDNFQAVSIIAIAAASDVDSVKAAELYDLAWQYATQGKSTIVYNHICYKVALTEDKSLMFYILPVSDAFIKETGLIEVN
ncbi:ABC transporter substrate-binding protein [Eubacterium sp. 1001713B170207_170306_E7]|uniref:substrate-binding periplasmic protein n=1 Tax=Eubacterium sp. 1001713B170207_170306_E7 TaxID=2787097 RepID=UPI00189A49DC|nr:ABC transporter substrate-binding protein [Eubacterium sp. 1001713B170207_170306_E7]